jgi:hypothetical protein
VLDLGASGLARDNPRPINGAVLRSKAVPAVASTRRFGLIAAQCGAVLIGLGGLGDQAVQKLMPAHEAFLGVAPGTAPAAVEQLFLAVLHALGFSLIAVGLGAFVLLRMMGRTGQRLLGWIAVIMAVLGDGTNAYEIHRTGSVVFIGPLAAVALLVGGVMAYALGGGATARIRSSMATRRPPR